MCGAGRQQGKSSPRLARPVLVLLFAMALFGTFWQYGLIGGGLRRYVLPRVLPPLLERHDIVFRYMGAGGAASTVSRRGLQVSMSKACLLNVLSRSPLPAWLLPPGLVVDGMEVRADWLPPDVGQPLRLPCVLRFDKAAGAMPRVRLRFPASELNALLSDVFADDWSEREAYFLGHYNLDQRMRFHSLHVASVDMPRQAASEALRFRATASGRLRYWFKDSFVTARLAVDVQKLVILFTFVPVVHDDGTGFDYRARVEALDIRLRNMAPWLERRVAKALARSMERSQNKPRKKARMARHRLPAWLPLDIQVDIMLTEQ